MKLANWFEIDDVDYCQYILQGYEITADENWVTWYLNGERHRVDGPAIIWADGRQSWYLNGERHRVDGPAIIYADGRLEWYLTDKELTEKEWRRQVETRELV